MNAWENWVDKDRGESCYTSAAFKSLRQLMNCIPVKHEHPVLAGNTGAIQDD
jgi:hypothetical protein